MMRLHHLLPALAIFLTVASPVIYGVSAQSSAATCTASIQALQAACGTDNSTATTCCPVYQTQVNAYYDCYCSLNSTVLLQLADACSFTLPQNLTSCFPSATPPPSSSPSPSPSPSPDSPPPPPSPPPPRSPPPPPPITTTRSPPPPPLATTTSSSPPPPPPGPPSSNTPSLLNAANSVVTPTSTQTPLIMLLTTLLLAFFM